MITPITREVLPRINNGAFCRYATRSVEDGEAFLRQVEGFGLEREGRPGNAPELVAELEDLGVFGENGGTSFHVGWISPACLACRTGQHTETFLTSTQCPRKCFFCFNPNQEGYEYFLTHHNDIAAQLIARFREGARFKFLGITGGEPLLHYDRVLEFLDAASIVAPEAYSRLYTSGAGLSTARALELAAAGLNEVRFSIKAEDTPQARERVLETISGCVGLFDAVMVEMPVAPDQGPFMEGLLRQLDMMGVDGINLLELCFPFHNAAEFARRGYRIKHLPYRIPYDWWYAGGLPIAGSEEVCLQLVAFAAREGLDLGVHYCSLENKLTGQVYSQNIGAATAFSTHAMSPRDHFLKSAKVFGDDCTKVEAALRRLGEDALRRDRDHRSLEFPLMRVPELAGEFPQLEVAITSCVAEELDGETVLRELAVAYTTTGEFDAERDW